MATRVFVPLRPFRPTWPLFGGLVYFLAGIPIALALDPDRALSQYRYTSWNYQNGLQQSSVLALAQSPSTGYIWIGTERGLVRFDGSRFVSIPLSAEGLAERRVTALAVATDDTVWAATNQGLFALNSGKKHLIPAAETPCADHVTLLHHTADRQTAGGDLLAGTQDGKLCRLTPGGWKPIGPAGSPGRVNSVLETSQGDTWLGTASGLWRRIKGNEEWQRLGQWGKPGEGARADVFSLAERGDGSVVAGTAEGFLRWHRGRVERWNPSGETRSRAVNALREDRNGNLWASFWPQGLQRISAGGRVDQITRGPLLEGPITHLLEDREGNLWAGTNAEGLFLLEDPPVIPFDEPEGLDRQVVWSVLEDRSGSLWMGTRKGLRRLDSEGRPASVPDGLKSRHTGALLEDRNGDVWVGIGTGVARIANGQVQDPNGQVQEWTLDRGPAARAATAIAERREGGLWVGTLRGLYRLVGGEFTWEEGLQEAPIHTLVMTKQGELWAATGRGAYVQRAGQWRKSPLGKMAVFSIAERPDGSLWMATEAEGLLRLRAGQVSRVVASQGLCANTNYSILDDGGGRFWLGSPLGVSSVSIEELEAVADGKLSRLRCLSYGMADGMRSAEASGGMSPASARGRNGLLWFATRGVVAIKRNLATPSLAPIPLLESAEYLPGKSISAELPSGQRDVSIRFTAPYFRRGRQWPLEYRLAGYDQAWQNGTARLARYTNLPPGSYRFEVRTAETAETESQQPVTLLTFAVPPRFVETPAFWSLLAASVLTLGFAILRARTGAIERRRVELEVLVTERTREAREAAKAKGEFLANMSHEIRTPMNGALGAAELLSEMKLSPEAREHVEMIRSSGEALLVLINDILDYSKIEAGKLTLESRPISLITCVDDALALVAVNANKKNLELTDHIDPSVPDMITGDAVRLRQMLLNLLSNAVKFTAVGRVLLRIEREIVPGAGPADPGQQLHFTVVDTGIGISAEGQTRLFQDFSQADASTTRRFGGTGLGLAITKRLCEAMGGRIWVESREGEGSSFHFTIPLTGALDRESPPPVNKALAVLNLSRPEWRDSLEQRLRRFGYECQVVSKDDPSGFIIPEQATVLFIDSPRFAGHPAVERFKSSHPPGRVIVVGPFGIAPGALTLPIRQTTLGRLLGLSSGAREDAKSEPLPARSGATVPLRILLADDITINQRVMMGMLRRLGHTADVVDNGLRVLEALERQSYDVVLLDVQMPEMDGIEAARCIVRRWPEGQRPRLVAITAGAFEQDRENCLAAGMDMYLSKPLSIGELAETLSGLPGRALPGVGIEEATQTECDYGLGPQRV